MAQLSGDKLVKIPDSIDFNTAAAMMLQGMTVEYLIRRTYTVKPGEWVLFHAAAGGVGSIAVQWLKSLGAHVIGTAGGPEKGAIVKSLGADHVIDYRAEDWVKRVKDITGGKFAETDFTPATTAKIDTNIYTQCDDLRIYCWPVTVTP